MPSSHRETPYSVGCRDLRVAVLGAGSWGTALAVSLASTGHDVTLWARREEAAETLRTTRHNASYLPEVLVPDEVVITSDLHDAVRECDLWLFATPSQSVRSVAEEVADVAHAELIAVSVAKGIERGTLATTTQVLADVLAPTLPAERIAVLYGPSHAEEVGHNKPTTVVAAAPDMEVAACVQETFMTERLRVYVNADVIGVEVAGSVKNVMALAAGIADGLGFGDNTKAAIVTRGLAEIRRLGLAMGAKPSTFAGLAGIGDLVVTCMSQHSRNRHLGQLLGEGATLEEAQASMRMVAEGVTTTQSVMELARRHQVEMPITQAVHAVLFEGRRPHDIVEELMTRSAKREDWLVEEPQGVEV